MQRLEVSVTLRQGRDYDMDREGTYVIQPGGAASAPCGGKVTGTKDELEDRLQEVLNSNDRGWSRKMKGVAGDFTSKLLLSSQLSIEYMASPSL